VKTVDNVPRVIRHQDRRTVIYPCGIVEILKFEDESQTMVLRRSITDANGGYCRDERFSPAIHKSNLRPATRSTIRRYKETEA
jgi:hypothetical protein